MSLFEARSIGVFDSGVGGLSIVREIRRQMPAETVVFVADQAHVPYGPRRMEQIRSYADGIARFLVDRGADLIIVACNTASAAALKDLRARFPSVPFVGMEPAVKPAAEASRSRVVGVLATPATFQGELFASVVERFGQGVRLVNQTVPGLVEEIEAGRLDSPRTEALIRGALVPILQAGADTIVLACTHYPFVIPMIARLAGPAVSVIDPAPAIARQAARFREPRRPGLPDGRLILVSTGDPPRLASVAQLLINSSEAALGATWSAAGLSFSETTG